MAILIVGATSEIARKSAELFASRGERLILAARNTFELEKWAPTGTRCVVYSAEESLGDARSAERFWGQCLAVAREEWGESIDGIYLAQGFLPTNASDRRLEEIGPSIFRNFTSLAIFLEAVARWIESQREATGELACEATGEAASLSWIAVISSVAGERGRFSNYPYGAAKAGLTAYLSGLRAQLFPRGVHVLTVKPGLVKTRMIQNRPQARSFTVVLPERVAKDIDRAIRKRKNVVYSPGWWRFAAFCVRMIPEFFFKRFQW